MPTPSDSSLPKPLRAAITTALLLLAGGATAAGAAQVFLADGSDGLARLLMNDRGLQVIFGVYAAFKVVAELAEFAADEENSFDRAFATVTKWFKVPFAVVAAGYALGASAASTHDKAFAWSIAPTCVILAVVTFWYARFKQPESAGWLAECA